MLQARCRCPSADRSFHRLAQRSNAQGRQVVLRRMNGQLLFNAILDFGEGCAGTLFIELATGSATHSDRANRVCGTVVGGFLLIRSATAFVLSSFRASVSEAAE